ncbi:MAG: isoprenoid biosynthesis glyoxalase ElbB [Pseudomonadales bacterium]|nr:isoprenoid biosynthesis glyoxalase ElbB [Pseudomonadales bacterium]
MAKIAVILSGCGVYDGSEIYETTLTLLALDRLGAEAQCMAPNIEQVGVINHLTGNEMTQSRNVLVESARLARGDIIDLGEANPESYDGVIISGGFGAAKNLSDHAVEGVGMKINDRLISFVTAIHLARKPVGLISMATTLGPKLFGNKLFDNTLFEKGVLCTVGDDKTIASAINEMGGIHENCPANEVVVDERLLVVSTPAYMLAERISEAAEGIEKLVDEVLYMTK